MSTTRATILRDVCEMLHSDSNVLPIRASTGLGSTTTLLDAIGLLYTAADANQLDGVWARIDQLVTNGPAAGEWSRVTAGGLAPTTGTITVSPPFTNAVQAATNYSLWRLIHPQIAADLLNFFLQQIKYPTFSPVSLFTDADMEASGTTAFNATTATLSKDTTASEVRHGAQSLLMSGSGGAPTAETTPAVAVVPGDQYVASSTQYVKSTTGTATLQVWDATNSAVIATASHSNTGIWMELAPATLVGIPSTCQSVTFRLKGAAVGDQIVIDDVILWPYYKLSYFLPSAFEDPSDIVDVGYFELGDVRGSGNNAYMVDRRDFVPIKWDWNKPALLDELAANPFELRWHEYNYRPLYIFGHKPFGTLATDTATTTCDRRLAVLGTMYFIYDYLHKAALRTGDPTAANWARARDEIGRDAALRSNLTRFKKNVMKVRTLSPGWYS